jgi:hypothetical protein
MKVVESIKGDKEVKAGPDKAKGGHPRYLAILSVANPVSMGSFRRQPSAMISLCVSARRARDHTGALYHCIADVHLWFHDSIRRKVHR